MRIVYIIINLNPKKKKQKEQKELLIKLTADSFSKNLIIDLFENNLHYLLTKTKLMKKKLSFLMVLLMAFVATAWGDTTVLFNASENNLTTHSDDKGIVTITDATGNTGIQQGSGSYKLSYGGTEYIPVKLSGSRLFNLTYSDAVTITKVTLIATSNGDGEGTIGKTSNDRTSLGTLPVRGSATPLSVDITGVEGLCASRQFIGIIAVEYSSTAPELKATPNALAFALNPSKPRATGTFTLTGKNLTNGEYSLTVPNLAGLSVEPNSFTVANGTVNQEFTVTYATTEDVAKATTAITTVVNDLKVSVDITYQSRSTAYTQSTVSEAATWDWSALSETVELGDNTTPTKSEEFLLADLDDRINFTEAFGDPMALKMEAMQFPTRGGYAQGTTIKFNTAVAGVISVAFSNTGGNRPYRHLFVNGKPSGFKSNASDIVKATDIAVPAGEVVLSGWLPTDGDESTDITIGNTNMLRWYSITFTPAEPVATKTIYMRPGIWASANEPTRYAVYMFNETDNAWLDMTAVEGDDGTFTANVPENYGNIILVRMDGTKPENNWNNKWNQTADINFAQTADKTLFTISSTDWGSDKTPFETSEYTGPIPVETKYKVILDDGQVYGTVEADKYEAAEGEQVALKVAVKEEYQNTYELDALSVIGAEGAVIETHEIVGAEYNYAFTMPAQNVRISATFKEKGGDEPAETYYTIKFKDNGAGSSDGTAAKTGIADLIADGADYVKATAAEKAYNGKEGYGVKLSSSSVNGSMTLTLAQSVKPTKITFKASAWVNSSGTADAASISINGKDAQELTADLSEYTVNYDGETEISEIAIAATKRAYITEVTVYTVEGGGDTPAVDTYGIVGDLTGGWETDAEMKKVIGADGVYILFVDDFEAKAGTEYQYKLRANKSWDGYQLPDGQKNFTWTPEADGIYTLIFTANINENTLDLVATKTSINTVAELNKLEKNATFKFFGDAIVVATATKGSAKYVYIKDDTGSSLIYDQTSEFTGNIGIGNVLTAPWAGTVSIYNGLFEAKPTEVLGSTSTVEVKYPEVTADYVKAENMNQVVLIKGLSIEDVDTKGNIKFTIGDAVVPGYNQFGIKLEFEGNTFDVVGAISVYNENVQFQPITITEVQEPQPAEIDKVQLLGDWNWSTDEGYLTLAKGEGFDWIGTLDLSKVTQDQEFKLVINGKDWIGTNLLTLVDQNNLVTVAEKDGSNFILNNANSGFQTYTITATWQANANAAEGWTLEIAGKDKRVTNTYTAYFSNTGNWENVYAYAYAKIGEGAEAKTRVFLGDWPGKQLTNKTETGLYKVEIEDSYAPQFIIFNNGIKEGEGAIQTENLAFVDGETYKYEKPEPQPAGDTWTVAGNSGSLFGTAWDPENTANDMTLTEGLYTWEKNEVTLTTEEPIQFKVVKNHSWDEAYPEQNYELNIPADGVYGIKITFNAETKEVKAETTGGPELQKFGVDFKTDKNWKKVYAYAWSGEGEAAVKYSGEWPGTELVANNGIYTYGFEATEAPGFIIFNDGTIENPQVGDNKTIDYPFENGATYTVTTEQTTAWVGEEELAAEEELPVAASTLAYADVKAKNIISIKATEAVAPSRGMSGNTTALSNTDITLLKADDTVLAEGKAIKVVDGGYEYKVADDATANELKTNGFKVKANNPVKITSIEVQEVVDIVISPESGDNIADALAKASEGKKVGNITINLAENGAYTVSAPIVAPASVTINGAGATVDASALAGNFIEMAMVETPTEWTEANVAVKELTVKGLKKALFYSACKNYFGDVTVDKCVVEQAADATTFDYTKGSTAVNFTVTNSTFYAPTATTKAFYSSQNGQKTTEYNGDAVQTFKFENNTMYNLTPGKNFFTHRQSNQTWLAYTVKNNIFVNCGKSGQTIKGMNGGQGGANPTWTIDGNIFNFEVDGVMTDKSADEDTGDTAEPVTNSVKGIAVFTDAAAGNFNGTFMLAPETDAPASMPGDPRWTLEAKASYAITIADGIANGSVTTNPAGYASKGVKVAVKATPASGYAIESITVMNGETKVDLDKDDIFAMPEAAVTVSATFSKAPVAITIAAEDITDGNINTAIDDKIAALPEGDKAGNITITLAENGKYTVTKSIEASASLTITGNGATIDASALEAAMIITPTGDLTRWMVGDLKISGVTVKGLKKAFYASAGKNYLYNDFLIDNSVIEITGTGGFEFDFRKGGVAKNFTINKSTLYAPTATGNSLYTSQSAQKGTDAPGVTTQTFAITNSTLYNIAKSKNFFTHRQNSQKWLKFVAKNNIFVNCGKSGQVIKGMNGGGSSANPVWDIDGNIFNYDGADTSAAESTDDTAEPVTNSVKGVISFVDAAKGDFNAAFMPAEGQDQPATIPGDPRWTITAVKQLYVIGDASVNGWGSDTPAAPTAMTLKDGSFEVEFTSMAANAYFAIVDKGDAATWEELSGHRYGIGDGDQTITLDTPTDLVKFDNGTIVIDGAGKYKVSVSADMKVTVTKTGDVEHTYTVAGSFYYGDPATEVKIFGDPSWDASNTANDMEKQTDGTYKKVYENVVFENAGNIQFKVVEDHAWNISYGWDATADNPNGNAFCEITGTGTGTITIIFNPEGATAQDKVKIEVTGVPTGINGINIDAAGEKDVYYNLQGVRVANPGKGVYIKNGKKVLVK